MAILLPVCLLLFLEVVLRLLGVGYSSHFFVVTGAGKKDYIENQRFGWRFFPPAVARTPQPMRIPVNKPREVCRIVVLGESAALGDPEPAFGFPCMLEVLLNERQLGRRFEVINAAMTAINSHAIVDIAADCRALKADYWVVYMGNNEVVGPYGAGSVFGPRAPPRFLVRAALAAKTTRIGQLLETAVQHQKNDEALKWGGMEMFLRQQCAASEPLLERVYGSFQQNLATIIRRGEQEGQSWFCARSR